MDFYNFTMKCDKHLIIRQLEEWNILDIFREALENWGYWNVLCQITQMESLWIKIRSSVLVCQLMRNSLPKFLITLCLSQHLILSENLDARLQELNYYFPCYCKMKYIFEQWIFLLKTCLKIRHEIEIDNLNTQYYRCLFICYFTLALYISFRSAVNY